MSKKPRIEYIMWRDAPGFLYKGQRITKKAHLVAAIADAINSLDERMKKMEALVKDGVIVHEVCGCYTKEDIESFKAWMARQQANVYGPDIGTGEKPACLSGTEEEE